MCHGPLGLYAHAPQRAATNRLSPARIIDAVAIQILTKWRHLLWPGDVTRIRANIPRFQEAISSKCRLPPGVLLKVFAFLDGTDRETCKPGGPFINQEALYDGHHHMPALGYLGVGTPDGLLALLFGPLCGWFNDKGMVNKSGLAQMLEGGLFGDVLLYGDCRGTATVAASRPSGAATCGGRG